MEIYQSNGRIPCSYATRTISAFMCEEGRSLDGALIRSDFGECLPARRFLALDIKINIPLYPLNL
jgi:hypothetical protein